MVWLHGWNSEKGRKSAFKGKNVLLTMMTVVKNAANCHFVAKMLKLKGQTFARTVLSLISVANPFLYGQVVARSELKYAIHEFYSH